MSRGCLGRFEDPRNYNNFYRIQISNKARKDIFIHFLKGQNQLRVPEHPYSHQYSEPKKSFCGQQKTSLVLLKL